MPHSDDFGLDDDDTLFLAAATQVEASQHPGADFETSPRATKKRRVGRGPPQVDGASSNEPSTCFQPTAVSSQAPVAEVTVNENEAYEVLPGAERAVEDKTTKQPRHRIHVPQYNDIPADAIFTQTQIGLDSSPSRIRGAIWKKPKPPPPPLFNPDIRNNGVTTFNGLTAAARPPAQQRTLNSHFQRGFGTVQQRQADEDAALAARLQAEEDAMEADLGLARNGRALVADAQSAPIHEELADLPSDAFASSSSPEKSPGKEAASQAPARGLRAPQNGLKQMTIFGQAATQDLTASQATKKKHAWPLKAREDPPTHHQLDENAVKTWVLFNNTLVALPTGLGKTFIAATVMLNYYRWTTNAQMIFMAPTKPLIAQQMDACYHIVGIPRHDTVLMTGETSPGARADEWLEKRVFFMTPQTVINDLKTGICDPKKIVLVVVDEAHKATGAYAYTEVIAFLRRFNSSFRVLALTATPGSTVEAVQAVIDHLGIARVELRTEQSLDIRPYTHEKQTDIELFDYSDEQGLIMELMSNAIRPVLQKLNTQNAYWSKDPMQLNAFGLQQARGKWSQSEAGRKAPMPVKGMVQGIFSALSSLAHGIGLLKFHGIGPFYGSVHKFRAEVESGATKGNNAKEIVQHDGYVKMMSRMDGWMQNKDFIGHPKLQYLREVILNHFLDAGEGAVGGNDAVPPSATRVMVFASFRDSTEEICRVLRRNDPMIRPHVFVGQAGSATSEGMNQKKQNEVIQDFKAGKYNTLVATSIGEEGLDIGDVDLIVCYDASSSPIRMLQRIGRTGRKRVGKVVLLLMRGKEEKDYEKAKDNYAYIQKTIADESKYNYHDDQSPRILPKEAKPVVDRRVIEIPVENSQPIDLNEKGKRGKGRPKKRPPKKFNMPDGVRTGFVKASKIGSDDDGVDTEDLALNERTKPVKSKTAARAPRSLPEPEPEVAQVPFLGDVLLSEAQQRELERKYAHTGEDHDMLIRAPDPTRYPEAFWDLGRTRYVRHGRAAEAVSKAMRNLHDVDDAMVERRKGAFDHRDLADAGPAARKRLVSPITVPTDSDDDLSADPLPKALKPKPKPRPRTKPDVTKSRGRPPHEQPAQRTMSHSSATMEGAESEPEPTPGDMRIGTQGIDIRSTDTSGEDDGDEPDSELDAFIARSDEVIETVSSSLPGTPEAARGKGKLVKKKAPGARATVVLSDLEEGEEGMSDAGSEVDSNPELVKAVPNAKKKRVVDDSDSD
ncbi:3'-5' DNA helicase [Friedmanniomyces endolithicus]|nr:3'-5' DNA helicase [Friedmanniomyces endolithicus]